MSKSLSSPPILPRRVLISTHPHQEGIHLHPPSPGVYYFLSPQQQPCHSPIITSNPSSPGGYSPPPILTRRVFLSSHPHTPTHPISSLFKLPQQPHIPHQQHQIKFIILFVQSRHRRHSMPRPGSSQPSIGASSPSAHTLPILTRRA